LPLLICMLFTGLCYAGDTTSLTVHFAFNAALLTPQAKLQLNDVLPGDSSIVLTAVRITGHTDQLGTVAYNDRLSVKRARAVAAYLAQKGLNKKLIVSTEGKGKSLLVTGEMDTASRRLNRRVTVLIEYEAKEQPEIVIVQNRKTPPPEQADSMSTPTLTEQLRDTATKPGDHIVLQQIYFRGGRHFFLPQSYTALQELAQAMRAMPGLEIEVQGHVCCLEEGLADGLDLDTHTYDLSARRAKAVYEYLAAEGIEPARMSFIGLAHRFPVTAERNERERTMNRRVEIRIIRK
jgi:outer membrane protein OmpA-like peptidoglycan-associated protein